MPLVVKCSGCEKRLRVSDEKRGKRLKCPGCGEAIEVPDLVDEDDFASDDDELPVPRKPTKKIGKKKSAGGNGSGLAIAIGSVVAILVLAGVAFAFWRPGAKAGNDSVKVSENSNDPGKNNPTANGVPDWNATVVGSWQSFHHKAGGFSLEVPSLPERAPKREEPGEEFYIAKFSGMPAHSSFIHYTTLERRVTANKPTAKILDIIAEVVAKPHKIIEKKPIEYQGQEGLEFLINMGNKDGIRRVRMFFHRDAIVEIGVVWGNGNEEPIADRDRLWNSLQFTK